MKIFLCILIGYLLGCINPTALIAKLKNKDVRHEGTGNLGATNAILNFGKVYGAAVLFFDIAKAFLAVKLVAHIFIGNTVLPLVAGIAAVFGHVFPFYLKFKGGKGLASFAGLVLAYDPIIFALLATLGIALALITNYSFLLPLSASVLFPMIEGLRQGSMTVALMSAAVGTLIFYKHWENVGKAKNGTDIKVRDYFKKIFTSKNT